MQHVQKLEPLARQKPPIAPLRVTTFRPSVWGRARAWAQRTLTAETVAEMTLVIATISLAACLYVGFTRALENYTIIPLP
jgi:hypothetical protein